MRGRTVVRIVVALLAAWGALAALAFWSGRLQLASEPAPPATPRNVAPPPAAPPTPGAATQVAPASAAPARPAGAPEPPLTRWRICTAAGTARLLRVAGTPRPRYLVHCGSSVELIGFDGFGTRLEPRRLARFEVSVPEPGLGAEPGGLATGDLDADGLTDLVIGSLLRDDRDTLGGGRVHWLRGASDGGFVSPRRLGDAAATEVAFVRRGSAAPAGLLVLRVAEPRLGDAAQLWSYAPGAAPLRQQKVSLGPRADALAAVDLNLDGSDELFVLLGAPPALRAVTLDETATQAVTEVALEERLPRELRVGDLDMDGHADLLVLGEKLSALFGRASAGGQATPRTLFDGSTLRDLQLVNAGGDARPDLVAYAHPDLLALEQQPDGSFVRRDVYRRRSALLGTLSLRVDQLDEDPDPELLLFGSSENEPGSVELVLITELAAAELLAAESLPLPDAPLALRMALP